MRRLWSVWARSDCTPDPGAPQSCRDPERPRNRARYHDDLIMVFERLVI